MAVFSTLSTLAPYHLLAYGILVGSTTYQSFVAGLLAFKHLPYKEFSALQSQVFPVYFSLQTLLSAFLLLTKPVTFEGHSASATLAVSFVTAAVNLLVLSPATRQVMAARRSQEEIDGKSCKDPEPSPEMALLNKKFAKFHGVSVLLNLANFFSLIGYSTILADGLLNA